MWVSNSLLRHKVWFAPNVRAEYAAKFNITLYNTYCIYLNVCVMKFEQKVSKEAKFSGKVK